jgi:hypothetical protein
MPIRAVAIFFSTTHGIAANKLAGLGLLVPTVDGKKLCFFPRNRVYRGRGHRPQIEADSTSGSEKLES